jgi:uncharacterized lipoprotein YmbA
MRKILVLFLLTACGVAAASSYYKLEMVKRVDQNLYSAKSGTAKVIIETKYCYEYAVGVDAILKYDQYSYDNKIIFDDNSSCDVAKVFVP